MIFAGVEGLSAGSGARAGSDLCTLLLSFCANDDDGPPLFIEGYAGNLSVAPGEEGQQEEGAAHGGGCDLND